MLEPQTTPQMQIMCELKKYEDEIFITIRVPRDYMLHARPAKPNLLHHINMKQFFGMLEDAVCMKLGIEPPQTNKDGHNVAV